MDMPKLATRRMRAWADYHSFGRGLRIWLYTVDANDHPVGVVLPTELIVRTFGPEDEGMQHPPTLDIPELSAVDLLDAIKQALERIAPVTDAHLKGLVEAKEANLADLRNILRKKGLMA